MQIGRVIGEFDVPAPLDIPSPYESDALDSPRTETTGPNERIRPGGWPVGEIHGRRGRNV